MKTIQYSETEQKDDGKFLNKGTELPSVQFTLNM